MDRRTFLTLASAVAGAGALAGCSTGPTDAGANAQDSGSSASASTASNAYPVSIEHALGSTTISKRPTRIATIGWSDADMLLALGTVPVGASKISFGGNKQNSTDYFDAALAKIGGQQPTRYDDADGAPVDEIAKLRPDLIFGASSGLTRAEYAKLSKIAPVVAYPKVAFTTPWQVSMRLAGQVLGLPDQATTVIKDTERTLATAAERHPQLKGKTFAWAYFMPNDLSQIGLVTSLDLRAQMMMAFGLKMAPFIEQRAKGIKDYKLFVSAEQAPQLDAQILLFQQLAPGQDKVVTKHRLTGQIPAFKSGAYVATPPDQASTSMTSPSPLSVPYAVQHFLPRLVTAAAKVKS